MQFKPTYIKIGISALLIISGVYALIIQFGNGDVGQVGLFYYEYILRPLFGETYIVFSFYSMAAGLFVLFSSKPLINTFFLTLVFFPALFIVEELQEKGNLLSQSLISHHLKSSILYLFGTYGLYLIEFIMIVSGLYGLYPFEILRSVQLEEIIKKSTPAAPEKKRKKALKQQKEQLSMPGTAKDKVYSGLQKEPEKQNADEAVKKEIQKPATTALDFKSVRFRYQKPSIDIFQSVEINNTPTDGDRKNDIQEAFANYKLGVDIGEIHAGPSVEKYQLILKKGSRLSQIKKFEEDIALALGSKININTGQDNKLFLESPRLERQAVSFQYLLETGDNKGLKIPLYLGVDSSFKTVVADLAELPHLMVAGTTGSGKSILVKSIIASMMYTMHPKDLKLILIDPKRVEFSAFNSSVFMAGKSIYESEPAENALKQVVEEMERRYCILEQHKVSNLASYNSKVGEKSKIPYLVVIIDEFADLIMSNTKVNDSIVKLAQKARACGIHLILATQRPSADVINGLLKANIPGRIALSVSSGINSRIILDKTGAENLLGKGDMILLSNKHLEGIRLQGAFISDAEIEKLVECSSAST